MQRVSVPQDVGSRVACLVSTLKAKLSKLFRVDARPEIMYVIGGLTIGGSERHLATIAPKLVARGWRVSLFSLSGDGPLRAELENGGVTILQSPIARSREHASIASRTVRFAVAAAALLVAMLRRRPSIVHFFLPAAYVTGAPLAWLAGIPVRIMSRRSLNVYQMRRPGIARLERHLHSGMDVVLGNSVSVVRELENEGVAIKQLGLIYNGVDIARQIPQVDRVTMRSSLGLMADTVAMVIVANLIPYKGHRDLLQALCATKQSMPRDWRLLIVGRDDGIEAGLRSDAEQLGLAPMVVFLGPRTDVPDILGASDLGLLCSHEEGFSNSVLEGMAASLPMIVTDVGGNAEAIVDGECGLVVPARNPQRLGDAIVILARDADLRTRLGQAGRRRVETYFTTEKSIDAYDELYGGLLEGRLPSSMTAGRFLTE